MCSLDAVAPIRAVYIEPTGVQVSRRDHKLPPNSCLRHRWFFRLPPEPGLLYSVTINVIAAPEPSMAATLRVPAMLKYSVCSRTGRAHSTPDTLGPDRAEMKCGILRLATSKSLLRQSPECSCSIWTSCDQVNTFFPENSTGSTVPKAGLLGSAGEDAADQILLIRREVLVELVALKAGATLGKGHLAEALHFLTDGLLPVFG